MITEWVSVNNSMPPKSRGDESDYCLIYNPDDGVCLGVYCYKRDIWYYDDGQEVGPDVTHWAPRPEPPTE